MTAQDWRDLAAWWTARAEKHDADGRPERAEAARYRAAVATVYGSDNKPAKTPCQP